MNLLECVMFGMLSCIIAGAGCRRTEVLAAEGSQAVLPCECSFSSSTNPYIVWMKDGKTNKHTVWKKERSGLQYVGSSWTKQGSPRVRCPHFKFVRGDFSLQISSVQEADGGLYTCRVEQGNQLVEREVMLRVIKVSFNPSTPMWGNNVLVTCTVTPRRTRATVAWKLNNSSYVPQTSLISGGDVSVVKEKATMSSAGEWTCVVRYNGQEGQASASLSVEGIIQPPSEDRKLYAAVGSAASLPCVFSPGLEPKNSLWEKLKQDPLLTAAVDPLPPSFSASSSTSRPPADQSASLGEVTFEDEGRYRCSGTVRGQRMSRTMQLVVAKIVSSKIRSSVMLNCQLSNASEVTGYEWVHVTYDDNGTESAGRIQKGKTLSITEGSEESRGQWTCRFYGEQGLLGNVTYHTALMSGLSGQNSSNVSGNTATIIGLGFLLLVLLLVLFQLYRNHIRRKRIFQFRALETIVHNISNEKEARERNREKI